MVVQNSLARFSLLFSRLIGIINDKRLCKTRDKKSAPIPGGLKPVLIVDPKRYVQCVYQNKAVEHWYISICMLFLNVCNLASRVTVFVGLIACFHSGVALVLQICLYFRVSRSC